MKDKYRQLLSTYRLRKERGKQGPLTRQLSMKQAEALRRLVERLNDERESNSDKSAERRVNPRQSCPHFVLVTPCAAPDSPRMVDTTTVVVKDISSGGISFVQSGPFTDPYFLVTFRVRGVEPICLLSKVRRMEPAKLGLYLVGGEFKERVSMGEDYDQNGQPGQRVSGA